MAEFTKIMEIRKRMCDSLERCEDCPLYEIPKQMNCYDFMIKCCDEAEQIILKWDKEHPPKTRLTDFLEKHPNAPLFVDGTPLICGKTLGYFKKKKGCPSGVSNCIECWNTPLED